MPFNVFNLDRARWHATVNSAIAQIMEQVEDAPEKILKPAVNEALLILKKFAKLSAPKGEFGLLSQSLDSKVVYNKRYKTVTGVVGPRRGLRRLVTVEFDVRDRRTGRVRHFKITRHTDPVKYAHIVELGTHLQVGSYRQPRLKINHPTMKPRSFLFNALEESTDMIEQKLDEEIQRGLSEWIIK